MNAGVIRNSILILLSLVWFACNGPAGAQPYTVKFGATGGRSDSQAVYLDRFQKELFARAGERFRLETYPVGQLGSMPQMTQGLQFGTIEMVILAPQHLRGVDARFGVVEAPGLLDDFDHANRAYWYPGFHDAYLSSGQAKGLVGVAMYAEGPMIYITRNPVRRLADFDGMKLRILATDIEQRLTASVGATGVHVEWLEIPGALQRRQIDGFRTGLALPTALKIYKSAKYVTLTKEAMFPLGVFVSSKFLEKLPTDLRKTLLDAARAAERGMTAPAKAIYDKAEITWSESGGEIIRLPSEEHAIFLKRAAEIGAEAYGAGDPSVREMYQRLKKAAAATKG